MSGFLTVVIVISAIFIVFAVIMQPSKDGGLGGLASGGVTDSVLSTNRNEFLAKTTWWLLAIFLISSLVLAKHKTREHIENEQKINTRSIAEEVSDNKITPALEDANDEAEKKAEDVKPSEDKVNSTLEQIKKEADELQKKADESTEDVKEEAKSVEEDASKKLEDAKKALPGTEK